MWNAMRRWLRSSGRIISASFRSSERHRRLYFSCYLRSGLVRFTMRSLSIMSARMHGLFVWLKLANRVATLSYYIQLIRI
jgi:hypothetical protein